MHLATLDALGPFLGFVTAFSSVILTHEAGHFLVAKKCGVKVAEFSFGFPGTPIVWRFWQYRETSFTLRLLPFGGFVRFEEGDENAESFEHLPPGKKIAVLAAGALVNMVAGCSLMVVALMGIRGINVIDAVLLVAEIMHMVVSGTLSMFGHFDINGVSGPVGIAVAGGKAARSGGFYLMGYAGLLSAAIGIMNLLPLPGCDGFHICLAGLEALRGKALSTRLQAVLNAAGLTVVMLLMAVITYHDMLKIFSKTGR